MLSSNELNSLLLQNIDRIVRELLPDGRRTGSEYHCANAFGGKGHSFSLNINKGIWSDFADSGKGGDLISLFVARAGNNRDGMRDVYSFLNIEQKPLKTPPIYNKQPKAFTRPKPDWEALDGAVFTYLVKERHIPECVLEHYDVAMHSNKWFGPDHTGPAYVLIYKSQNHAVNYYVKYIALERNESGKKFVISQPNGLQVLFGMNAVHSSTKELVITSGEIDAMSFGAQNITAVSITNGDANMQWIENSWNFLSQFKTIYIAFDMDESGQTMVDPVAARLGVERCKRVHLPYKDANECLINGVNLHDCLKKAKDITPIGFIKSDDLMDSVWQELLKGPRNMQGIPFMGWDGEESVRFRIRPHEVTVYLGLEFSGKSTLLYQLAAYLAGVHKEKVAIASLEESPEAILGVMLAQWMATPMNPELGLDKETFEIMYSKTIAEHVYIYNDRTAEAPLANLLDFAQYCVKRYGVKHVILDSLTCTNMNVEDNEEANAFMKAIIKSCNETQAHYHIIAHARKGTHDEFERASIPKKRDIKGSVTIPALATNIVAIWRNSLKQAILDNQRQTKHRVEDVIRWEDAVLAVRKNKVAGEVGEFGLWFDQPCYRFKRCQSKKEYAYIAEEPPTNQPF